MTTTGEKTSRLSGYAADHYPLVIDMMPQDVSQ